jgi:hypothetical protein
MGMWSCGRRARTSAGMPEGPKASICLHHEAGYMTASVPTRASVIQAPLDVAGGSIYDNADENSRKGNPMKGACPPTTSNGRRVSIRVARTSAAQRTVRCFPRTCRCAARGRRTDPEGGRGALRCCGGRPGRFGRKTPRWRHIKYESFPDDCLSFIEDDIPREEGEQTTPKYPLRWCGIKSAHPVCTGLTSRHGG